MIFEFDDNISNTFDSMIIYIKSPSTIADYVDKHLYELQSHCGELLYYFEYEPDKVVYFIGKCFNSFLKIFVKIDIQIEYQFKNLYKIPELYTHHFIDAFINYCIL